MAKRRAAPERRVVGAGLRLLVAALFWLLAAAPGFAAEPAEAEAPVAASGRTLAADLIAQPRVLVIAHRGASADAPENTLPAFQTALDANSDLVELDYVHTADGVPLVIHDDTLDRTTNAVEVYGGRDITVVSKPLAELLKLDAGRWFDPRFAGTPLPTLEESLDLIQAGSVTLVERKAGDAKTCVALLERKKLVPYVVVQSFDWDFLADCHRLSPRLTLGALGSKELTDKRLADIARCGAKVVGWHHEHLDRKSIERLHSAGYRVWAWTVDDRRRAAALVDAGVDGIISDVPGRMRAWVDNPR
ncbi:MAG: glycerophosphodiester phosphodiesterase [Pirellulales bacterium]